MCFNEGAEEINLIKSILRVTPHKRPTMKDILDHPYFHSEDTLSTKESDLDLSKLNKSMVSINSEFKNISSTKPQQNSYPFYVPPKGQKKRP